MHKFMITRLMLVCSNVFMIFAWYGYLKNYNDKPWIVRLLDKTDILAGNYLSEALKENIC